MTPITMSPNPFTEQLTTDLAQETGRPHADVRAELDQFLAAGLSLYAAVKAVILSRARRPVTTAHDWFAKAAQWR